MRKLIGAVKKSVKIFQNSKLKFEKSKLKPNLNGPKTGRKRPNSPGVIMYNDIINTFLSYFVQTESFILLENANLNVSETIVAENKSFVTNELDASKAVFLGDAYKIYMEVVYDL